MLEYASIFTDNMILQRDKPIIVWGKGASGEAFELTLGDSQVSSSVDTSGEWKVEIPARGLGGTLELVLKTTQQEVKLVNILMGDVWFCSGQSNMEWSVNLSHDAEGEILKANHEDIRLVTIQRSAKEKYQDTATCRWEPCTSDNVGEFSAVGYYFGRSLQKELGVPIGLINSSWGGTCVEAWSSRESLEADPDYRYLIEGYEKNLNDPAKTKTTLVEWENKYLYIPEPPNKGLEDGWHGADFDDAKWGAMVLPGLWQTRGHDFNGCFWFRKNVRIPKEWIGKELEVSIGACDKSDYTYVNGSLVGSLLHENDRNAWSTIRKYDVSSEINNASEIQIAVRVVSMVYGGGMSGAAANMFVNLKGNTADTRISLEGDWKYDIEYKIIRDDLPETIPAPQWGDNNQNSPFALFAGMVYPVIPFALKGFIWYQGESNTDRPLTHKHLLPAMIKDWRERWNDELPFYMVQLANFGPNEKEDELRPWSELRETQKIIANNLDHCEMACIIDIGEEEDIHPKNKQDVGYRLSLLALKDCYERDLKLFTGPLYQSAIVEGDVIVVSFDQAEGLHCVDDVIREFELAGEDDRFYSAVATIDGCSIKVTSEKVEKPLYVRYAWIKYPSVNLFNEINLPAAPFNTHPNLWQFGDIKLKVPDTSIEL